jgi:hypothetical protein
MHVGEDYYHGRKAWAMQIKNMAGDRPLFMPDNLREASLYSFYSGEKGVTLYTRPEKKSQYELWGYEDSLQGKEVLFLSKYPFNGSNNISLLNKAFYYGVVPAFQSYYNGLMLSATINETTRNAIIATEKMTNVSTKEISFQKNTGNEYIGLVYSIEQAKNVRKADAILSLTAADNLAPGATLTKRISIPIEDIAKGDYELYLGLRSGVLPDAILSGAVPFTRQ